MIEFLFMRNRSASQGLSRRLMLTPETKPNPSYCEQSVLLFELRR